MMLEKKNVATICQIQRVVEINACVNKIHSGNGIAAKCTGTDTAVEGINSRT